MLRIFCEREAFDRPCWVAFESEYAYFAPTLLALLWQLLTQWRAERHLVG